MVSVPGTPSTLHQHQGNTLPTIVSSIVLCALLCVPYRTVYRTVRYRGHTYRGPYCGPYRVSYCTPHATSHSTMVLSSSSAGAMLSNEECFAPRTRIQDSFIAQGFLGHDGLAYTEVELTERGRERLPNGTFQWAEFYLFIQEKVTWLGEKNLY